MASFYDRVVVFEPLERFEAELQAVLAPNCIVHRCALADLEGSATFDVPSESDPLLTQTASLIAPGAGASHSEVAVQVRRLDDFAFGAVDFIKVDVEGAEFAFLPGAVATLRRCRPVLLIEIEDRHTEGRRGASSMRSPASATGPSFPLPNPTAADRLPSAAC